jgi:hypothetical protein
MNPIKNDCDKLFGQNPKLLHGSGFKCQEFELLFCGSQANRLSSICWLLVNYPLNRIIPSFISHFKQGHFAQNNESLRLGQALNNSSFEYKLVKSKYQTPENSKFGSSVKEGHHQSDVIASIAYAYMIRFR